MQYYHLPHVLPFLVQGCAHLPWSKKFRATFSSLQLCVVCFVLVCKVRLLTELQFLEESPGWPIRALSGRSRAVAELTCAIVTDLQSLTVGRESTRIAWIFLIAFLESDFWAN